MTGFLHEKEFSRKNFLKGTGAVVAGASVVGAGLAGKASAVARPTLAGYNADPAQIDSWLVVNADNTIILRQTKMETGNGITTGFTVKSLRGKAVNVTTASFVGSHSMTLTLAQGRWYFYWGSGKKTTFFVAS